MAPGDPISPAEPSEQVRSLPSATRVAANYGSLEGRVFFITGASAGIGKACARALASANATVFMACRAGPKARDAYTEVRAAVPAEGGGKVFLLDCDVGCPDSVRQCAEAFLVRGLPLHALINNAGVNGVPSWGHATPGVETQFAVNFLGAFELQRHLHQRLSDTKGARVVNIASDAHARVSVPYAGGYVIPSFFPDVTGFELKSLLPPPEQGYDPLHAYAFSNLCRILWTRALAKRVPYPVVCMHPSNVAFTGILQHMPWLLALRQVLLGLWWDVRPSNPLQTLELCARCPTWCAVAPLDKLSPLNGRYLSGNLDCRAQAERFGSAIGSATCWRGLAETSALASRDDLAEELFAFAEGFVATGRKEAIAAAFSAGGRKHGPTQRSWFRFTVLLAVAVAVAAQLLLMRR